MAVTGDDALRLEESPQVVDNLLVGSVGTDFLDHAEDEGEHFLVGETVERAGETGEGSGVGEEGVRER